MIELTPEQQIAKHYSAAMDSVALINAGKPIHQALDYTKVIPMLVAAIQEQQALITALTIRITALEGTP